MLSQDLGLDLGGYLEPPERRGRARSSFKFLVHLSPPQKSPLSGLDRNPPPDHWAVVSGLPTYVAQNGLVSNITFKGESFESGGRVKGFQIKRVGKTMASMDLSKPGSLISQLA